jgi:hypothetical protein
MFPGQFRPTDDEFATLWAACIFAVDANVLLNLYRYSPETRKQLEATLSQVKDRLFIPHQAAKEFLKNRLNVTAGQADEYTRAVKTINDLAATLTDQKKHPFLDIAEVPDFTSMVKRLVEQLENQKASLLGRLTTDEILEFVESTFEGRTGTSFSAEELAALSKEGETRYLNDVPPGYKDGKKDASGDPYRKYGDLILWKQLIARSKEQAKPVIFITDDKKEDWWLEQSGRTIGPRTELREEFISEAGQNFWMYTVDKFIEESARATKTPVSEKVIAEIIEVREEVNIERTEYPERFRSYRSITRDEMLQRLKYSEKWAAEHSEGWLALHHYVKDYLGAAGYDWSTSYGIIRQLEDEGLVEVYEHQGKGHDRSVKAIRLVKGDQYSNRPLEDLKSLMEQKAAETDERS